MNTGLVKQSIGSLVKRQDEPQAVTTIAENNAEFTACISLITAFNGLDAMPETDLIMAKWAVNQFAITKDDFKYGYREAFKDKYTGAKMTMKHIVAKVEERRASLAPSTQKYPFGEVLRWLEKRNLPLDYTPYFDFKPDNTGKWYYLKAEFKEL